MKDLSGLKRSMPCTNLFSLSTKKQEQLVSNMSLVLGDAAEESLRNQKRRRSDDVSFSSSSSAGDQHSQATPATAALEAALNLSDDEASSTSVDDFCDEVDSFFGTPSAWDFSSDAAFGPNVSGITVSLRHMMESA